MSVNLTPWHNALHCADEAIRAIDADSFDCALDFIVEALSDVFDDTLIDARSALLAADTGIAKERLGEFREVARQKIQEAQYSNERVLV